MSADTGNPDTPPLGDQFAAFADELREWAETNLAAGHRGLAGRRLDHHDPDDRMTARG